MPGNSIVHYGAVRMDLKGSGKLHLVFYDFEKVNSQALIEIVMTDPAPRFPTRLSNFITQGAMLKGYTDAINETMRVNSITIFVRSIYAEYPS